MTHPLSRVPFLGTLVDERFLEHRRRATSFAGIVSVILAACLLEYRYFRYGAWEWDLFAVVVAFLVMKMSLFAWYRKHD